MSFSSDKTEKINTRRQIKKKFSKDRNSKKKKWNM